MICNVYHIVDFNIPTGVYNVDSLAIIQLGINNIPYDWSVSVVNVDENKTAFSILGNDDILLCDSILYDYTEPFISCVYTTTYDLAAWIIEYKLMEELSKY